jgi:putative spermidine/putrescine transport system permease protein
MMEASSEVPSSQPARPAGRGSLGQRLSTLLYLRPRLTLALLLGPPLLWLVVVYQGSLLALVLQSFYHLDSFTGQVVRRLTLETYRDLLTSANM